MTYKIHTYGDPVLRKDAEPVTDFDRNIRGIVENMIETMYRDNGIGLAAPQIGISNRIAVIDRSFGETVDDVIVLINPEILETEGECTLEEGCLSVPGVYEDVVRPEKILVRFQDIEGNVHETDADGMLARVVLHESDHLDGILFVDRLSAVKRRLLAKTLRSLKEEDENA